MPLANVVATNTRVGYREWWDDLTTIKTSAPDKIYVCTCISNHTYTHTLAHSHAHTHTLTRTHTHSLTRRDRCSHTHTHTHTHHKYSVGPAVLMWLVPF